MRTRPPSLVLRMSLVLLLLGQMILGSGCTAALWRKETFAQHYRPAVPTNLKLLYSNERKDILVQYDEMQEEDGEIQSRRYWLEPNAVRVNRGRKPHFVSQHATNGLMAIRVVEDTPDPPRSMPTDIHAVAYSDDYFFTIHAGEQTLDPYLLPIYTGRSQTVKQVLLTPFAVVVDATIVGAIISLHSAPEIFASLSR